MKHAQATRRHAAGAWAYKGGQTMKHTSRDTRYDLVVFAVLGLVALVVLFVLEDVARGQASGPTVQLFRRDSADQLEAVPPGYVFKDGDQFNFRVDTGWVQGDQGTLDLSWDHRLTWYTIGSQTCAGGSDPGYSQTCPTVAQFGHGPGQVVVWVTYHQVDGQNGPLTFRATYNGQTTSLALAVQPSSVDHRLYFPSFYH